MKQFVTSMKTFSVPSRGRIGGFVVAVFLAGLLLPSYGQVFQQPVGAPFVFPMPQPLEVGPVLDVIPYVLSDGYTVNLTLIPSLVEFVGYDDPATVVESMRKSANIPQNTVVVPTVLPRFRVRQATTTVNVWDGQTVVLGGLMYETSTRIRDKVPVLGDLPLFGRFFRNESRQTQKKNLVIFVTPTIIDPAGNRLHSEDEMPFARSSIPPQPDQQMGQSASQPVAVGGQSAGGVQPQFAPNQPAAVIE